MVGLSHFNVYDQVSTSASVQDVGHRDHQVVQSCARRLVLGTQLAAEDEGGDRYDIFISLGSLNLFFFIYLRATLCEGNISEEELRGEVLTSSPSGQLLISRP